MDIKTLEALADVSARKPLAIGSWIDDKRRLKCF